MSRSPNDTRSDSDRHLVTGSTASALGCTVTVTGNQSPINRSQSEWEYTDSWIETSPTVADNKMLLCAMMVSIPVCAVLLFGEPWLILPTPILLFGNLLRFHFAETSSEGETTGPQTGRTSIKKLLIKSLGVDDKIEAGICPHWFGWYFYTVAVWLCIHVAAGTASLPAPYNSWIAERSNNDTDFNVRAYSTQNPSVFTMIFFIVYSLLLGFDMNEEFSERMQAAKADLEKRYPGRALCVIDETEKHIRHMIETHCANNSKCCVTFGQVITGLAFASGLLIVLMKRPGGPDATMEAGTVVLFIDAFLLIAVATAPVPHLVTAMAWGWWRGGKR